MTLATRSHHERPNVGRISFVESAEVGFRSGGQFAGQSQNETEVPVSKPHHRSPLMSIAVHGRLTFDSAGQTCALIGEPMVYNKSQGTTSSDIVNPDQPQGARPSLFHPNRG